MSLLGIIGQKFGMTSLFTDDGTSIPVTVIHVSLNKITQIKTAQTDGYNAIQVTTGNKKLSRVKKPEAGHFAKANVEPGFGLWEFRLNNNIMDKFQVGQSIAISILQVNQKVDVTSISKGKGFQGGVKRHNFRTQDASHGNSVSHRVHGSTGQNQTPGRVFKNKKMAGHLGHTKNTIQNIEIIKVDSENGVLLLKGGIPGPIGSRVIIKPAIKQKLK